MMSSKEIAKSLIDQIPESKLVYIIPYLQGAAIPDEIPNKETIEAMLEIEKGEGHSFHGTTEELFIELMEE